MKKEKIQKPHHPILEVDFAKTTKVKEMNKEKFLKLILKKLNVEVFNLNEEFKFACAHDGMIVFDCQYNKTAYLELTFLPKKDFMFCAVEKINDILDEVDYNKYIGFTVYK